MRSILKGKGRKIEPCGTLCSILDFSLKYSLILGQFVGFFKKEKNQVNRKGYTSLLYI